ncbi:hypothetical protein HK096_009880, partial [Nowakowskiella sp. JEL0078]
MKEEGETGTENRSAAFFEDIGIITDISFIPDGSKIERNETFSGYPSAVTEIGETKRSLYSVMNIINQNKLENQKGFEIEPLTARNSIVGQLFPPIIERETIAKESENSTAGQQIVFPSLQTKEFKKSKIIIEEDKVDLILPESHTRRYSITKSEIDIINDSVTAALKRRHLTPHDNSHDFSGLAQIVNAFDPLEEEKSGILEDGLFEKKKPSKRTLKQTLGALRAV